MYVMKLFSNFPKQNFLNISTSLSCGSKSSRHSFGAKIQSISSSSSIGWRSPLGVFSSVTDWATVDGQSGTFPESVEFVCFSAASSSLASWSFFFFASRFFRRFSLFSLSLSFFLLRSSSSSNNFCCALKAGSNRSSIPDFRLDWSVQSVPSFGTVKFSLKTIYLKIKYFGPG